MPNDDPDSGRTTHRPLDRRQFLAATGTVAATGLTGCSGLTQRSFAATPVRLPTEPRNGLGLAELFADSKTTTRERSLGGQSVEVTITNQLAGYGRSFAESTAWAGTRPTLVERFAGNTSSAPVVSGLAAVASDLGLDEATPEFVSGETSISGDRITLVIPERARQDGEVTLDELMTLHHAADLGVDELTSEGGNNYLVDLPTVLPARRFRPGGPDWRPDERWVAGHEGHWLPDDPSSMQCVVCLGERSPESVFGVAEMPGRRVETGESVATEDTLLFVPAPKEYPDPDNWSKPPAAVFDQGFPLPTGGPSYGLGVMATPDAQVNGDSANPLVGMETAALLERDAARRLLRRAGATDADEVEWLRGPTFVGPDSGYIWTPSEGTVLSQTAEFETYVGILGGADGHWGVGIDVLRATPSDHVVAAAVQRRPLGTTDWSLPSAIGDSGWGMVPALRRGRSFTADVVGRLEAVETA